MKTAVFDSRWILEKPSGIGVYALEMARRLPALLAGRWRFVFLVDDEAAHYTFVETLPWSMKRNPRVYNGKFISITRQGNGTLRPNFKPMPTGSHFSLERYAFGVYLELHKALEGLVGEK